MARTRKVERPNSLVASAAAYGKAGNKNFHQISRRDDVWQREAWNFYRTVGEFRYSCDWVGSMLSKAILFATHESAGGKVERLTEGSAVDHIDALFGDSDGKAEMLRLVGIHMTVAGECYLLGYPDKERGSDVDKWEVVASTELRKIGEGKSAVWMLNGERLDVDDPEDVLAVRIWRPDPVTPKFAISPARAVLSILGEIVRLTEHVAAQVDSRLAGAGILLMPSEMTFPAPPDTDGVVKQSANNAEDLMKVITKAMSTSIEDRGDASALVPIVITAPGEAIEKVQHLTFWTELDNHAIELRNEAIRRLALGMDMPPEVLQGIAESNHWSAWQADESAIKSHTEPLLKIITSAIAQGYLRPLLDGDPTVEDVIEHYSVAADTSEMRLRPNRSKEALELYNLGVLSREALLRETGFDPDDGMGEKERALWFTEKVASGSTTPELVEAALKALNVNIEVPKPAEPAEVGQEGRPAPSLKDHPEIDIPDREVSERRKIARQNGDVPSATTERKYSLDALAAAADQIVLRALERAGNRMKNQMKVKPTFAAVEIYRHFTVDSPEQLDYMLDDAWTHVGPLATRFGVEEKWLTQALHSYTQNLIATREPHDYDNFAAMLTLSREVHEFGAAA